MTIHCTDDNQMAVKKMTPWISCCLTFVPFFSSLMQLCLIWDFTAPTPGEGDKFSFNRCLQALWFCLPDLRKFHFYILLGQSRIKRLSWQHTQPRGTETWDLRYLAQSVTTPCHRPKVLLSPKSTPQFNSSSLFFLFVCVFFCFVPVA